MFSGYLKLLMMDMDLQQLQLECLWENALRLAHVTFQVMSTLEQCMELKVQMNVKKDVLIICMSMAGVTFSPGTLMTTSVDYSLSVYPPEIFVKIVSEDLLFVSQLIPGQHGQLLKQQTL